MLTSSIVFILSFLCVLPLVLNWKLDHSHPSSLHAEISDDKLLFCVAFGIGSSFPFVLKLILESFMAVLGGERKLSKLILEWCCILTAVFLSSLLLLVHFSEVSCDVIPCVVTLRMSLLFSFLCNVFVGWSMSVRSVALGRCSISATVSLFAFVSARILSSCGEFLGVLFKICSIIQLLLDLFSILMFVYLLHVSFHAINFPSGEMSSTESTYCRSMTTFITCLSLFVFVEVAFFNTP
jgi:hypothetical protein